jgi:hypothetical protein
MFRFNAQVQMTLTPVPKRAYGLRPGEEPAGVTQCCAIQCVTGDMKLLLSSMITKV